jgi:phospholipid transport system substrate-binding protein
LLIVAAVSLTSAAAGAPAKKPDEVVREAIDLLETGLDGRREELAADKDALYALIDGILLPRFERTFAARLVLGQHWKEASEAQRDRFIKAFYLALLKRYANGILEFDTNRIDILPYRGKTDGRYATVKTTIQLEDGTKVPVHYDLVNARDQWKLFNVNIEGVSYVKNFRTEFNVEIKQTSLAALIERLENEAGIADGE